MSAPNQPPRPPSDHASPTSDQTNRARSDTPASDPLLAYEQAQLSEQIARLTRQGYVIVSQTDTTAQLRCRKHFSIFWALFWLVIGAGVGLFLYVAWYTLVKRDKTAYLRITHDGQVLLSES